MTKRLSLLTLALALAACGHGKGAPTLASRGGGATGGWVPAADDPSFDGLFRSGARWRFTVTAEDSHWDDADPDADANGQVTTSTTTEVGCRVVAVVQFPGGRASEVACDDGADYRLGRQVAGVWIQTADGLWHDVALPEEGVAPVLDPAGMLLPARPVAGQERNEEPAGDDGPAGGFGSTRETSGEGGDWCVRWSAWGGDESWEGICLDDDGPASGEAGFAGGAVQEARFERLDR